MRKSPAARFKQAKLAELAIASGSESTSAPERETTGEAATEYDLLLAALGEDMRRLKSIQSTEGKVEAKREMIDRYSPHVDATLAAAAEAGKAVQDPLLMEVLIWRFDIGDYTRALDLAEHALRFGLRLPERFQRSTGTLVAELVAEDALKAAKIDKDFDLPVLHRAHQLTSDADMPDVVRAKLHKAMGLHLVRAARAADENPDSLPAGAAHSARKAALEQLQRAMELNSNAGVVKDIERLTSWLEKNPPAAPAASEDETE